MNYEGQNRVFEVFMKSRRKSISIIYHLLHV